MRLLLQTGRARIAVRAQPGGVQLGWGVGEDIRWLEPLLPGPLELLDRPESLGYHAMWSGHGGLCLPQLRKDGGGRAWVVDGEGQLHELSWEQGEQGLQLESP